MNKKITPSEAYYLVFVKKKSILETARILKIHRKTVARNLKKYI